MYCVSSSLEEVAVASRGWNADGRCVYLPDHSLQLLLLLLLLLGKCSSSAPDPLQLVRKMQQSLNRQLFITEEEVSEQLHN